MRKQKKTNEKAQKIRETFSERSDQE